MTGGRGGGAGERVGAGLRVILGATNAYWVCLALAKVSHLEAANPSV